MPQINQSKESMCITSINSSSLISYTSASKATGVNLEVIATPGGRYFDTEMKTQTVSGNYVAIRLSRAFRQNGLEDFWIALENIEADLPKNRK